MSGIGSMMGVGRRSMMNAQTGLHTVSHNIANKETEGYSRQRTETYSNDAQGSGKRRIGMGARAAVVRRINNPYLERQLGNEKSELATSMGRQQGLMRLEQIYNEQTVEGFNSSLTKFFNAFRELSTNPESMPRRTMVKEAAQTLSNDFRNIYGQLREVDGDINSQIEISVNELNSLMNEVATLNTRVQEVELSGGWANDERDRRDLLLKKMGEIVDIKWAEGEDSTVTVSTAHDALLVVGGMAQRVEAVRTPAREGKSEGDVDVVFYHHDYADPLQLTERIKGGRLGGLLSVRAQELYGLKRDMDNLAFTIASEVNDMHSVGFNSYNQTGILFFDPMATQDGAAQNMRVNSEIMVDAGKISVARDPNRPGDNRVAIEIAELQYGKPLFDGSLTLDEFYNGIVGELGIKAQHVNHNVEVQGNIVRQLENLRESMSGVSIDEEAAKMIELQKQFDASARVIRTADEILDTVINIRRY
ncbi:MAG: flagellar hook-associated protein FlgK [Bdellovibrionales bacterium]|nr:flagellar hook-associated protein FlgK [Bdellovibrionales bacterium]